MSTMMQEFGTLDAALAAAVGEDAGLLAELRCAFLEGARTHLDALDGAGPAEWRAACWRLHGLAASFGALALMSLAAEAGEAPPSPDYRRRLAAAVAALEE